MIKQIAKIHLAMKAGLGHKIKTELAFQENAIVLRWVWLGGEMANHLTYAEYTHCKYDLLIAKAKYGNKLVKESLGMNKVEA